jgi:N-acetyl-anhydromuramyl-L-alanine amidase AmpD
VIDVAYTLRDLRGKLPVHPTRRWAKRNGVDTIVLHTTASDNQDPAKTALYHITPGKDNHISTKGCPAICYHDFITKTGTVFRCNNYRDWVWHAGLYNKRSIGVVMAFRGQDGHAPEAAQLKAAEEHITTLCLYLHVSPKRVIGHRECSGMFTILGNGSKRYRKTCPGMGVNLDMFRSTVASRMQRILTEKGLYDGLIDGIFGPKSTAALKMYVFDGQLAWMFNDI